MLVINTHVVKADDETEVILLFIFSADKYSLTMSKKADLQVCGKAICREQHFVLHNVVNLMSVNAIFCLAEIQYFSLVLLNAVFSALFNKNSNICC